MWQLPQDRYREPGRWICPWRRNADIGVNPDRMRVILVMLTCILFGSVVATADSIGFVGSSDGSCEIITAENVSYQEIIKDASFEDVYDHIDLYGTLFAKEDEAQKFKDEVAADLEKIGSDAGKGKTLAVVYPGIEGASTYAYGNDSMSNPIVEATGLENVFGDVDDRVFEISAEQLVAKNPDVILILHSGQDGVKEAVTSLAGAETITAVKEDKILPMLLAFAEPPSPLAIDGVEQLKKFLSEN